MFLCHTQRTPLHYAATRGRDVVDYLVTKGAYIHSKDKDDVGQFFCVEINYYINLICDWERFTCSKIDCYSQWCFAAEVFIMTDKILTFSEGSKELWGHPT